MNAADTATLAALELTARLTHRAAVKAGSYRGNPSPEAAVAFVAAGLAARAYDTTRAALAAK